MWVTRHTFEHHLKATITFVHTHWLSLHINEERKWVLENDIWNQRHFGHFLVRSPVSSWRKFGYVHPSGHKIDLTLHTPLKYIEIVPRKGMTAPVFLHRSKMCTVRCFMVWWALAPASVPIAINIYPYTLYCAVFLWRGKIDTPKVICDFYFCTFWWPTPPAPSLMSSSSVQNCTMHRKKVSRKNTKYNTNHEIHKKEKWIM